MPPDSAREDAAVDRDLEAFDPPTDTVSVGGETLTIQPIRVVHLPALIREVKALMTAGVALPSGAQALDQGWLLDLVEQHLDAILRICALATGRPADWVGQLDPMELVELALKIVEVNADFFAQRLGPVMARVNRGLRSASARVSSTPPIN